MTYKELYEKAAAMLDRGEITLGDFNKMVKPLDVEIHPEPHWIPVEQELPEQDKICLVCGKNGGIYVARFWRNENIVLWTKTGTGKFVNAVAWMPLPEPFKGVTE